MEVTDVAVGPQCKPPTFRGVRCGQQLIFADDPSTLIVGEEDLIFPPEVIAEVQKVIPGSRMEVVPGAAHSAHFELAAVFNRLVAALFAGVGSASPTGAAAA